MSQHQSPVDSTVVSDFAAAAISSPELASLLAPLSATIIGRNAGGNTTLVAFTSTTTLFSFWRKLVSAHTDRHVMPAPHPFMKGKEAAYKINGPSAVVAMAKPGSPAAPATSIIPVSATGSSLSYVNTAHAYRLYVGEVILTVTDETVRSEDGAKGLGHLLACALGLTSEYIEVHKGFEPPKQYPHPLVMMEQGYIADGSALEPTAHHCAWTYDTLKLADDLEGSHVPCWFPGPYLKAYAAYQEATRMTASL